MYSYYGVNSVVLLFMYLLHVVLLLSLSVIVQVVELHSSNTVVVTLFVVLF